jgi:hypothetical protein
MKNDEKKEKGENCAEFQKTVTRNKGYRRQTPKSIKKKARMEHGKPYHFYPGNPLIL